MILRGIVGRTAVVATAIGITFAGLPVSPAAAVAGQTTWEYATVTAVGDGDTVTVRTSSGTTTDVRLIGLQAPEVANIYRTGECGSEAAKTRLRQIVPVGSQVILRSGSKSSTSQSRPFRTLFKRAADGSYSIDPVRTLLWEGLALWYPSLDPEAAKNREYRTLSDQGIAARRGLFAPGGCGTMPHTEARLRMWIQWDAPGEDSTNPNGEYAVIRNLTGTALPLAGWRIGDSSHTKLAFPTWASVAPWSYVVVKSGKGTASGRTFYFNSDKPMFNNPRTDYFLGDGAYLWDPKGNLRVQVAYPCPSSCGDQAAGRLALAARYDPAGTDTAAGEYVTVRNSSTVAVWLEGYRLLRGTTAYTFPTGARLQPGASVKVVVGTGTNTLTTLYWGRTSPLLTNSGDKVVVESLTPGTRVACTAWGSARC